MNRMDAVFYDLLTIQAYLTEHCDPETGLLVKSKLYSPSNDNSFAEAFASIYQDEGCSFIFIFKKNSSIFTLEFTVTPRKSPPISIPGDQVPLNCLEFFDFKILVFSKTNRTVTRIPILLVDCCHNHGLRSDPYHWHSYEPKKKNPLEFHPTYNAVEALLINQI